MFNLNHLSILTTPQHYLDVVHRMESAKDAPSDDPPDYWQMLSIYLVSRCPICGQPYHEPLDTYNLRWWGSPFGHEVFWAAERTKRCKHMFMVGRFINFNGIMPSVSSTELRRHTHFIAEAPHIIPVILGPESTCQAVIHSLPICRIEGEQFVPRYTLYIIAYYDQPKQHASLKEKLNKFIKDIPDARTHMVHPYMGYGLAPEEAETWWDLKFWVEHKKLQWLVPDTPDLPLRTGPLEQFPYGDIEGRRVPYEIIVPPKPLNYATIEGTFLCAYKHKYSPKPEAGKYCLQKQGEMWVVSRTENGQQTYFKEFESESDACRDVFHAVTGRNIVYNVSHGWSMEQFDDDRVGIKRRNSP